RGHSRPSRDPAVTSLPLPHAAIAMADSGKRKKRSLDGKHAAKSHPSKKAEKTTMSDSGKSPENVFELDRIRRLVELMKEHDLSEIDLREARHRIRICRGPKEAPRAVTYNPPPPPPATQAPAPASPKTASPATDGPNIALIKSPMVGTYYSRPNPKAEAYVKVGSKVDATTTICIIEAMKVFNEIPAEVRGTIVAILVDDGEAVEFEKPLFKVDTSQ
ncbi:MAG: acetyl-CoA carboxylase biotin carboxyl carrier protein, partial [Pirellulaceae bacterium]